MVERTYQSACIAHEQLESAIRLYTEDKAYFSAITLAGAAEEILGKLAKLQGKENSLDILKNAASQIYEVLHEGEKINPSEFAKRANYVRNKIKHVNPGFEPMLTLDVEEEARDLLSRAIENYWLVNEQLSPAMERFEREKQVI